jgi:hypothetical protein
VWVCWVDIDRTNNPGAPAAALIVHSICVSALMATHHGVPPLDIVR